MTTNPTVTFEIPTSDDKPVWADLYTPGTDTGPLGSIVILCHGLKGYRRWGFVPLLARSLSGAGIAAMAIDFSHNGVAGGDGGASGGRVYPYPEMFRNNTLDRERNDLAAVIRWVRRARSTSHSWPTTHSAMSIPAETPAAVTRRPSRT